MLCIFQILHVVIIFHVIFPLNIGLSSARALCFSMGRAQSRRSNPARPADLLSFGQDLVFTLFVPSLTFFRNFGPSQALGITPFVSGYIGLGLTYFKGSGDKDWGGQDLFFPYRASRKWIHSS